MAVNGSPVFCWRRWYVQVLTFLQRTVSLTYMRTTFALPHTYFTQRNPTALCS